MDLRDGCRRAVQPLVDRLSSKPEVVGVAILSSAAACPQKRYFDAESDIDLSVLVSITKWSPAYWRPHPSDSYRLVQDQVPPWTPNFLFHLGTLYGLLEVNVNQLLLPYETDERTVWDHDKCDVYVYKSEVVYDPHGELSELIHVKTAATRAQFPVLIRRLSNRLTWDVRRTPEVAAKRHGPEVGHHLLNHAIDQFIELVYLLNDRFIAARKWRLVTLRDDGLLGPEGWVPTISVMF